MAKTLSEIKSELGITSNTTLSDLLTLAETYEVISSAEINKIKAISVLPLPNNVKDRATELKTRFTDIVLNEDKGQVYLLNVRNVILTEIINLLNEGKADLNGSSSEDFATNALTATRLDVDSYASIQAAGIHTANITTANTTTENVGKLYVNDTAVFRGTTTLQGDLVYNGSESLTENISDLETDISSEATTRANADTTLQTNIDNEETARENADSTLQTQITANASDISDLDSSKADRSSTTQTIVAYDLHSVGTLHVQNSSWNTYLRPTEILRSGQYSYTHTFPNKSGTFAMTSDITTLDNDLQGQIDTLKSVQNVVDTVATYSALTSLATTNLDANDKVQVIADENHGEATTIYNWNGSSWVYVGAYGGNSYTKTETDTLLNAKASKNGSASEDFTTDDLTVSGTASVTGNATVSGAIWLESTTQTTIGNEAGGDVDIYSDAGELSLSGATVDLYTSDGDLTIRSQNGNINLGVDGAAQTIIIGSDTIIKDETESFVYSAPDGELVADNISTYSITATEGNVSFTGNLELTGNVIPTADSTSNLGSSSKKFANVYADNITTLENNLAEAQREIENLKQSALGNIMQEATYSGTAYEYSLDSDTMPNGYLLKIGGMSYKNNQLVQNGNFESASNWSAYRSTFNVSDNIATITVSADYSSGTIYQDFTCYSSHQYLICGYLRVNASGDSAVRLGVVSAAYSGVTTSSETFEFLSFIVSASNDGVIRVNASASTASQVFYAKQLMAIDLTAMYGSGNEPSTYAEFIADFPRYSEYVPYTTGDIVDTAVTSVVNRGANLFNNEDIVSGYMLNSGNAIVEDSSYFYCNYIKVNPSTTYSYNLGINFHTCFYDINKTYISGSTYSYTFTTPSNCYYMRMSATLVRLNTLMIVKGSTAPSKYLPYRTPITTNIPTAVQNLDGYGKGISSSVCNYIDTQAKTFEKMVGRVDLLTLTFVDTGVVSSSGGKVYYANNLTTKKFGITNIISSKFNTTTDSASTMALNTIKGSSDSVYIYVCVNDVSDITGYLYYELATTVSTDISSYLGADFDLLTDLEGNGTLVFNNTNEQKAVYEIFTYEKL